VLYADRADLARAIEKWGGPNQLAEDLAYGVPQRGARQTATKDSKLAQNYGVQHDQASVLGSLDYDSDEPSMTTKISANAAAARARSIASTATGSSRGQQLQHVQAKQSQERPQIANPLDIQAREKQPIVNNRRRIAVRRKTPKLPTMRQEIDNW